jgi:putative transposase
VKKSRFTDEQIAFALKQAETGTRIDEICRKLGISDATFYKWRQKYGGLGPSELRKLKQLEEEISKLKRIVSDLSLDVLWFQLAGGHERVRLKIRILAYADIVAIN